MEEKETVTEDQTIALWPLTYPNCARVRVFKACCPMATPPAAIVARAEALWPDRRFDLVGTPDAAPWGVCADFDGRVHYILTGVQR